MSERCTRLGGGVTGGNDEADAVAAMLAKKIVKIDVLQSAKPHPSGVIAGNSSDISNRWNKGPGGR
jgi:hypothetical protein